MIYQVYGFNIIHDQSIFPLKEYEINYLNKNLPTVKVSVVDKLEGDKESKVEIINEYAHAYFSKDQSFFELADGGVLKVTSDEIVLCGECFDIKRISEELNGPSIIMESRYHKRAVLHGSAFLYKGKAYLILANPGAGKSTLTTAMVKYHNEISFLTDDIISVSEDGKVMFKGIHLVNLNDDSLNELFSQHLHNEAFFRKRGIKEEKTVCNIQIFDPTPKLQSVEIGGIILLDHPISDEVIKVKRLDKVQAFCDIVKNVKFKKSITNEILLQEMNVINKMIDNEIFVIRLQLKHDYRKLRDITMAVKNYIDGCC